MESLISMASFLDRPSILTVSVSVTILTDEKFNSGVFTITETILEKGMVFSVLENTPGFVIMTLLLLISIFVGKTLFPDTRRLVSNVFMGE
jgi:hypothetical protein